MAAQRRRGGHNRRWSHRLSEWRLRGPEDVMDRRIEVREKALKDLQHAGVLMLDGHFNYGNGYHGRVYLNPHQLFRHPSTIWRFAQDLIDLMPSDLVQRTE